MTRKFKLAGVLMAVVAMFAVMASAAQAQFTAASYPVTINATSNNDIFDAFGSTVKCTENKFTGELTGPSQSLKIVPSYKKCTAFGLPATVNFTSCYYIFTNTPGGVNHPKSVDIECTTAGDAIDITIFSSSAHTTAVCHVTVPVQTGLTGTTNAPLTYDHDAPAVGQVTLTGQVPVTATQVATNAVLCPPGTHTTNAEYTIQPGGIVVSGQSHAGVPINIDVLT